MTHQDLINRFGYNNPFYAQGKPKVVNSALLMYTEEGVFISDSWGESFYDWLKYTEKNSIVEWVPIDWFYEAWELKYNNSNSCECGSCVK